MTLRTELEQVKRKVATEQQINQKTEYLAWQAVGLSKYYYRQYHRTRHKLVRAILLIRVLKAENAEFRLNGTGFTNGDSDQF